MAMVIDRIKELMEDQGLSNSEFARRININPSIISHIMSGRNKVSLQVIENITSEFTNVNADYLITGSGSLYRFVTNVKPPAEPEIPQNNASAFSAFPMEGVRHAAIPGSTSPSYSPPDESEKSETAPIKEESKVKPNTAIESTDENEIERIVIFYRNGSFKAYCPE